jgi:ribonuclease HII
MVYVNADAKFDGAVNRSGCNDIALQIGVEMVPQAGKVARHIHLSRDRPGGELAVRLPVAYPFCAKCFHSGSCCWQQSAGIDMWLIGTDEAGYGPNLGPLVIAATAWYVEGTDSDAERALHMRLDERLANRWQAAEVERQVVFADSKTLFSPAVGLRPLELGVGAALSQFGEPPADWRTLWRSLAPETSAALAAEPWFHDFDCRLPRAAESALIEHQAALLHACLAAASVRLGECRCVAVFPDEFNTLVERWDSKGELLSRKTLALVRQMLDRLEPGPALIHCDKHGGRNRYAPLLQTMFPEYLVEIREEGRVMSRYAWGPPAVRREFRFVAKGDRFLPAALASMFAKYLRELAMLPFNEFWQRQQPGLKPTAGYPVDAQRFRAEIQTRQHALGIPARILWRNR